MGTAPNCLGTFPNSNATHSRMSGQRRYYEFEFARSRSDPLMIREQQEDFAPEPASHQSGVERGTANSDAMRHDLAGRVERVSACTVTPSVKGKCTARNDGARSSASACPLNDMSPHAHVARRGWERSK